MANEQRDEHVERLIEAARVAHAGHLPPGAESRLRETITSLRSAVATLNTYPLTNADEPDTLFAAYRREG